MPLLAFSIEPAKPICPTHPYMAGGDLRDTLHTSPASLSAAARFNIALDIATGLRYLHGLTPSIVHRDVKSANILLDMNQRARVSDVGLAREIDNGMTQTRGLGTPGYIDPEYLDTLEFVCASDVFSYGVVLLELLTGLPPTDPGLRPQPLRARMIRQLPRDGNGSVADESAGFAPEDSRALGEIAIGCVASTSDERPGIGSVMQQLEGILSGAPPPRPTRVRECVVCLDAAPSTRLRPCFHSNMCSACAAEMLGRQERCPTCRDPIASFEEGIFDDTYAPPASGAAS